MSKFFTVFDSVQRQEGAPACSAVRTLQNTVRQKDVSQFVLSSMLMSSVTSAIVTLPSPFTSQ